MFSDAEPLKLGNKPKLIFSFSAKPEFERLFGITSVTLRTTVSDREGNEIFKTQVEESSTSGGLSGDYDAAFKFAYAKAVKESVIQSLNHLGAQQLESLTNAPAAKTFTQNDVQRFLGDTKPSSIGTGFFINQSGQLITASHLVNSCLLTKIKDKDQVYNTNIRAQSRILNIALLELTEDNQRNPVSFARLNPEIITAPEQEIFTASYPVINAFMPDAKIKKSKIYSQSDTADSIGKLEYLAKAGSGTSGGPIVTFDGKLAGMVIRSVSEGSLQTTKVAGKPSVNIGLSSKMISQFLDRNNVLYSAEKQPADFATASQEAINYTARVFCYK
nr:serine protease [Aliamphritea spongicola]